MNLVRSTRSSDLILWTRRLLWIALGLAFLHHVDHALRVDHSGWPFRDTVTPFTYSLAAYPVILFALFGPSRLFWARWALLTGATAFTIYAHTLIESPATQFHMWAHNASAHYDGLQNAFGVQSRLLGALSVSIGMALNVTAILATATMLLPNRKVSRSDARQ